MASHPILAELSGQLPETARTFKHIQEAAEFEKIARAWLQPMSLFPRSQGRPGLQPPSARPLSAQEL